MCSQAIDQQCFLSVLRTAQVFYCLQPLASGNRTLELFPVPCEKYSGLLPGYILNNCILLYIMLILSDILKRHDVSLCRQCLKILETKCSTIISEGLKIIDSYKISDMCMDLHKQTRESFVHMIGLHRLCLIV